MGQKINANGLRLKKRLNWSAVFCAHSLNNYSKLFVDTCQIDVATGIVLSKMVVHPNKLYIYRGSKNLNICSKLAHRYKIYNPLTVLGLRVARARADAIKSATTCFQTLSLISKNTHFQFSNLHRKKNVKTVVRRRFTLLSPKLISAYIFALLDKHAFEKMGFSTSNLIVGITTLLRRLLKPFANKLLGVKIICSGRWKKTRSGRKQKLRVQYGIVRNPSLSNVILFDFLTRKTKFGACGVKVWISRKRMNKNSVRS